MVQTTTTTRTANQPTVISALPRISVIVPARNARLHLARCLEGLSRSDYDNFEVIVVDDCSTDNTPQIAARYGARCFQTVRAMGPAGARNLGAQHAAGEILLFVDADVVVPSQALAIIAQDFADDPELAAVFGSYDDQPAWPAFISQYKNLMHHYVHQQSSEQAATFWAGCGAIRREVFEEFHGFDAATYRTPSIEDIALGLEMAQQGRRIRLDKQLEVKHLKCWTVRSLLRADILYRAIPWTKLILASRQLPRDLNLTYVSRVSSLLVGLLALGLLLCPFSVAGWLPASPAPLLGMLLAIGIALMVMNLDVYQFFLRKRGWWFAARAVAAHWSYYLYSGATFLICSVMHLLSLPSSPARKASVRRT